jgi:hypothetical protein
VKKISNDEIDDLEKKLEAYCLFALTWYARLLIL